MHSLLGIQLDVRAAKMGAKVQDKWDTVVWGHRGWGKEFCLGAGGSASGSGHINGLILKMRLEWMGFCQVVKCSEEANLTCLEGLTLYNLQHPVWNAKVGSQEIPGVTGKFGLGVRNEAGQRLIEFSQESTLVVTNTIFQQHNKRLYMWTSPEG